MPRKNNRGSVQVPRGRNGSGEFVVTRKTNRRNTAERAKQRERLAKRDGWWCHWCKCPLSMDTDPNDRLAYVQYPTIEHLVRKADHGSNADSNCVLACKQCNNERG